jgi:hypothetical protein
MAKSLRKGQIGVEYMIIAGFVVFLILGVLGIAFFYSNQTTDVIRINQLTNFADKLIISGESVFYSGEPSKLTVTSYLPLGVQNISIFDKEILVRIRTNSGMAVMSFSSNVPVSGNISITEGVKVIEILAGSNEVVFREK